MREFSSGIARYRQVWFPFLHKNRCRHSWRGYYPCDYRSVWRGKAVTDMQTAIRRILSYRSGSLFPAIAFPQEAVGISPMAQGRNQTGWRIVAFIFGLPGTLLTFLVVSDSGGRA